MGRKRMDSSKASGSAHRTMAELLRNAIAGRCLESIDAARLGTCSTGKRVLPDAAGELGREFVPPGTCSFSVRACGAALFSRINLGVGHEKLRMCDTLAIDTMAASDSNATYLVSDLASESSTVLAGVTGLALPFVNSSSESLELLKELVPL